MALEVKSEFVLLSVSDNGKGISQQTSDDGVGLATIRERATLLGGFAQIQNLKGGGTEILISVPCH